MPEIISPDTLYLITVIGFLLCFLGIGIFTLPIIALIWILYFTSTISLGGGIAIAGIAIASAIVYVVKKKTKR